MLRVGWSQNKESGDVTRLSTHFTEDNFKYLIPQPGYKGLSCWISVLFNFCVVYYRFSLTCTNILYC
jgi:hypothetical protein